MRRHLAALILTLGAVMLLAVASGADPSFQFTSIDFPGALLTNAQGINSRGDIVGWYVDTTGKQHGFKLSEDDFTSFDYPGAMVTDARGINRHGDIVGAYINAPGGPPNMHGYLLKRGTFSEVQFPGYLGTIAQRISPRGDIYGCNHNTDFMASMHGFMRTTDGYSAIDVPASMNNGATPDGSTVAGFYTDMNGQTHGYLIDEGSFMPFDVPNSNVTQAWDINPKGLVVGNFRDTSGKIHGFLKTDNEYATIDFPGASVTAARGINRGADIVGFYVDTSGKTHGFLRSRTDD